MPASLSPVVAEINHLVGRFHYDTERDVLPAIEAGATGYLLKDTPRLELLGAVEATARGEGVLSPPVSSPLMYQVHLPKREAVSDRELEVLRQVAVGSTNRETAERLFLSEATVNPPPPHLHQTRGQRPRSSGRAGFESGLLKPGGST